MERMTGIADLQDEPLPGLPLVEIAGHQRVLVENHKGIVEYGPETICVKVKFGQICIRGSQLELAKMTKGQLIITGCVECVQLIRGCD